MRIAIVHYHLRPGGVSTVITGACRALKQAGIRHTVLSGDTLPGLGYLDDAGDLTSEQLTARLRQAAVSALDGPPDVWHFHNHSLGKNRLLPDVIQRLANDGERLILQIHDLAEHGRPSNHRMIAGMAHLYPVSPRIRYAFLNSRDRELFIHAGLPHEHSLLLPNPVYPTNVAGISPPPPLLFAPIRGIRRKNLGELVMLAALLPANSRIAVSRAPLDPVALALHDAWQSFADERRLPIDFAVTDRLSPSPDAVSTFETWLAHASHFVTTSVAEGFGMPFLEAAAHGKPLIGRHLPHLATDPAFQELDRSRLYDRLLVPVDWVGEQRMRQHLQSALLADHRAYRRPLELGKVDAVLASMTEDGRVDFGNLPERLQLGIVHKLVDQGLRDVPQIATGGGRHPAIDWLETVIATPQALVPSVPAACSPATYQQSLVRLYEDMMDQPSAALAHVPPAEILTACLEPRNFHFLQSTPHAARPIIRAVIFDIYGSLLVSPPGGVKPDPSIDAALREIIRHFGHDAPESPSTALDAAVRRHHAAAGVRWPEVDLRQLWREVLDLPADDDTAPLVAAIEAAWHPVTPMPGVEQVIRQLAASGLSLGLLSNAQSNTLASLGPITACFDAELTLLSYQHGIAKPSPALFERLSETLAARAIAAAETLYIGNDPLHDIVPAAAVGWMTALFRGHPDSLREGDCSPDLLFDRWQEMGKWLA